MTIGIRQIALVGLLFVSPTSALANPEDLKTFFQGVRVGVNLVQCLQTDQDTMAAFLSAQANVALYQRLSAIKDTIRFTAETSQCDIITAAIKGHEP